ncbi:MAG: fumarylacetoacetate hydrolase family protein [bacterium]|nr:fumarylacetoacetate hydrolase family protein [bacterium]
MRLATFTHRGRTRPGVVVDDDTIADLAGASGVAPDVAALLVDLAPVRAALATAPRLPLADVHLEAPIPRPGKFLGVGLNYASHAAETKREPPAFPVFFNKQVTCVNPPFDPIQLPRVSTQLDYEGELAFVIGRRCRHVPRGRAREVIGGFTIVDDVSVRDWQRRAPTLTLGKSFDTHGPMGPWIVTTDAIDDPHALALETRVNGVVRQAGTTADLIFDCFTLVEILSTVCTLEPGDVVTTGTPAGVGVADGAFLRVGDLVRITIAGIGAIEHRVIAEPEEVP